MGVGKYSPTVSSSYARDQEWWRKSSTDGRLDADGYDSYGYRGHDGQGVDRAGYSEDDYQSAWNEDEGYYLNNRISREWSAKLISFAPPVSPCSNDRG